MTRQFTHYHRWRPIALRCAVYAVLTVALVSGTSLKRAAAQRPSVEMMEDVELNDVRFVDAEHGWAIGDRGVILYTDNGGRQWHHQQAGVSCRLTAIDFVDQQNGWIVGGWTHPYTAKTTGVVLRTRDGGRRWTVERGPTLPALKYVKFLDVRHGWAVGNSSAMYPAGVFRTNDGGRSWTSMPTTNDSSWLTGDFRDMNVGAVAGRNGAMGIVRNVRLDPARMPGVGARSLNRMRFVGPTGGWLIGDGGLVFQTRDGGLTWQAPPGRIPLPSRSQMDFRALATLGPHCWIAGSPGGVVLHTPDYGNTWEAWRTNQPLPLRGMHFIDERRGWAVGALGTILVTGDGGRTWHRQRSGGTRVAMLGIFSSAKTIPWEVFAKYSGNQGYLSAVEMLTRETVEKESRQEAPLNERTRQALLATGGSHSNSAYQFPVRDANLRLQDKTIVDGWNRQLDGRSLMLMERLLVRKIRQWRPEVVVTEADGKGLSGISSVISRTTLSAVAKAADPTAYPEQLQAFGIQPWSVKKVYGALPEGTRGGLEISTSDLAVRLGRTIADQASIGRALIEASYKSPPRRVSLNLLLNQLNEQVGKRDIFTGIPLPYGGEARRQVPASSGVDATTIIRAAQKRRNLEQLIERSTGATDRSANWAAQVKDLTGGLNDTQGGEILYQLAHKLHRAGNSDVAADLFSQMIEQYPQHPLSDSVMVWLVQYYSSGEVLWRQRRDSRVETRLAASSTKAKARDGLVKQVTFGVPVEATPFNFKKNGRARTAFAGRKAGERQGRALALGKTIERTRPSLYAEPRLRFPLSASLRTQGYARDAERYFQLLTRSRQHDAWWECAQSEIWMTHGRGVPSKSIVNCNRTNARPYLDGKLDDGLWTKAQRVPLKSQLRDDQAWPAVAMFTSDEEYLYLAVNCRKAPGSNYRRTSKRRQRDTDLSSRDHVDILLDVDRDYATYYRLTVDHRGWGRDDCFGDLSWNPSWSIAVLDEATQWTAEMAIPWKDLAAGAPTSKSVWAVGVQRTVPGVGFQAWNHPSQPVPVGQGFGLLVFE